MFFIFQLHYFKILYESIKHLIKTASSPVNVIIILFIYASYDILIKKSNNWLFIAIVIIIIDQIRRAKAGDYKAWYRDITWRKRGDKDGERENRGNNNI